MAQVTRRAASPRPTCSAACSPAATAGPGRRAVVRALVPRRHRPHRATPVPGRRGGHRQLRDAGIRVCVVTGLSRRLLSLVLDTLGWWRPGRPGPVPRGRAPGLPVAGPGPVRHAAARREDVREAAFAGSTDSGILSGRRAGAGIVAGVLTGGHTRDRLRPPEPPTSSPSIAELPALLAGAEPDAAGAGARRAAAARGGRRPPGVPAGAPRRKLTRLAAAARRAPHHGVLRAGTLRRRAPRGYSSAGRAPALQAGGQGFESP